MAKTMYNQERRSFGNIGIKPPCKSKPTPRERNGNIRSPSTAPDRTDASYPGFGRPVNGGPGLRHASLCAFRYDCPPPSWRVPWSAGNSLAPETQPPQEAHRSLRPVPTRCRVPRGSSVMARGSPRAPPPGGRKASPAECILLPLLLVKRPSPSPLGGKSTRRPSTARWSPEAPPRCPGDHRAGRIARTSSRRRGRPSRITWGCGRRDPGARAPGTLASECGWGKAEDAPRAAARGRLGVPPGERPLPLDLFSEIKSPAFIVRWIYSAPKAR